MRTSDSWRTVSSVAAALAGAVLAGAACSSSADSERDPRLPHIVYHLEVEPTVGCIARGKVGGPFALRNGGACAVHNDGTGSFLYALETTATWLTLDAPATGILLPLRTLRLRLGVDAARAPQQVGKYTAHVLVRNAVTSFVEARIPLELETFLNKVADRPGPATRMVARTGVD